MSFVFLDRDKYKNDKAIADSAMAYINSKSFRVEDLYLNGKKRILVIPNEISILKLMKRLKFKEFDDYILEQYYKKKIVILYGNCHVGVIANILNSYCEFRKDYEIYPLELICTIKSKDFFDKTIFRNCDVLIHQSIQENNRYGKDFASSNIISKVKKECKVIAVPNVYHMPMVFFPQYVEKQEFKLKGIRKGTIFFRDEIIEDAVHRGATVNQIIEDYKNADYYSKQQIEQLWEKFLVKLELREKDWDVKVTNFIKENSIKQQLFYDPNHPTNLFLHYIAIQVLEILSIDISEINSIDIPTLDSYEMPICQSVQSFFGVKFDLNTKEFRTAGVKLTLRRMDIKSYVRQYLCLIWQEKEFSYSIRLKSLLGYSILYCYGIVQLVIRKLMRYINRGETR